MTVSQIASGLIGVIFVAGIVGLCLFGCWAVYAFFAARTPRP